MATTVTYKGQTLATVENQTKTLQTKGTWCEDDFTLTDVTQGGAGEWTTDGIAEGTEPNGAIVYNGTTINQMAFAGSAITSFVGANVTTMGWNAFGGCPNLVSASFPAITNWQNFNVNNASYGKLQSLRLLDIPSVITINAQSLTQMPSLTEVILPSAKEINSNGFSTGGSGITTVDLGESFEKFKSWAFNGSQNILNTVIIRNTQAVPIVENSSNSLPKRTVNYYVPSALISSYQTATNWATYYNDGYCNFIALEGSPYESEDWYLND